MPAAPSPRISSTCPSSIHNFGSELYACRSCSAPQEAIFMCMYALARDKSPDSWQFSYGKVGGSIKPRLHAPYSLLQDLRHMGYART